MLRLLSSEPFQSSETRKLLSDSFVVVEGDCAREDLLHLLANVDVLWVNLRHQIDREVLACAPVLRWIATPTTGLNHVDLQEVRRRGIELVSLRGESTFLRDIRATAELTIGLTLALLRHIPAAVEHVREQQWNRDLFQGSELFGKTCGIIGLGRLGRIVATYMLAFGATVIAHDPEPESVPDGVDLVSLKTLAERADIVTVHASYQPSTHALLNRAFFSRVKTGAMLVNTARGELIEENALIEALQSGRLAGAALDTICEEQTAGQSTGPLVQYAMVHPNLLITPHIGGNTEESRHKTEVFLAKKLIANCQRAKVASASQKD